MKWLLLPAAVIGGALIYGFSKTSSKNQPIDPSFANPTRGFAVGDTIIIDSDKMNFSGPHDTFRMQITSIEPNKITGIPEIKAKSIDPKLPNNPLGIGPNPIPVPVSAIVGRGN